MTTPFKPGDPVEIRIDSDPVLWSHVGQYYLGWDVKAEEHYYMHPQHTHPMIARQGTIRKYIPNHSTNLLRAKVADLEVENKRLAELREELESEIDQLRSGVMTFLVEMHRIDADLFGPVL